jgi:hypothetical protein
VAELLTRDVEAHRGNVDALRSVAQQDGENIRALARIAELRERKITDLEGGRQSG